MSIAFVFPGQGSQLVGMGRDLYAASAGARAVFDAADAALGIGLARLCFEGPEDRLTATENVQPALLATCAALLAAIGESAGDGARWRDGAPAVALPPDHPLAPAFAAGHSLGEYTALLAAGALDLTTALRLVRRRGELMAQAREGSMAAVIGMDEAPLEEICRESSAPGLPVVIANYNSPGQLVISGAAAGVEQAGALAKQRGARRVLPLKVSAAFHSPLMAEAAEGLAPEVLAASVGDARIPVIGNVTAEPLRGAAAIRRELIAQVTAPVRWIASVQRMAAAGVHTFVEIGPGTVLTGLIRRIAPQARLVNVADMAGALALGDLRPMASNERFV